MYSSINSHELSCICVFGSRELSCICVFGLHELSCICVFGSHELSCICVFGSHELSCICVFGVQILSLLLRFLYLILETFRQCAVLCFSIIFIHFVHILCHWTRCSDFKQFENKTSFLKFKHKCSLF